MYEIFLSGILSGILASTTTLCIHRLYLCRRGVWFTKTLFGMNVRFTKERMQEQHLQRHDLSSFLEYRVKLQSCLDLLHYAHVDNVDKVSIRQEVMLEMVAVEHKISEYVADTFCNHAGKPSTVLDCTDWEFFAFLGKWRRYEHFPCWRVFLGPVLRGGLADRFNRRRIGRGGHTNTSNHQKQPSVFFVMLLIVSALFARYMSSLDFFPEVHRDFVLLGSEFVVVLAAVAFGALLSRQSNDGSKAPAP